MSVRTRAIRPQTGFTEEQEIYYRSLVKSGMTATDIAHAFGVPLDKVEIAVATVRTPNPHASRRTINGTLSAGQYLRNEALPGEPRWQTLDRLIEELEDWRAGRLTP